MKAPISEKQRELLSDLHHLCFYLKLSFEGLKVRASSEEIERIAFLIYEAMTTRNRSYHNVSHVFELLEELSSPTSGLAVLYHDIIYFQLDRSRHPELQRLMEPFAVDEKNLSLELPNWAQAKTGDPEDMELLYDVFGFQEGDVLTPGSGMNEFLSARVAQRSLKKLLNDLDLLHVLASIEMTRPFRPIDSNGKSAAERLYDRILSILEKLPKMEGNTRFFLAERIVKESVLVAHSDLMSFCSPDVTQFLDKSWALIFEGNTHLQRRGYKITSYREALRKVESFLSQLNPDVIFPSFRNFPKASIYESKVKQAKKNLQTSALYIKNKLVSIALIEALADLTGGDSPLEFFMGIRKAESSDEHPSRIEHLLDRGIGEAYRTQVNADVLRLLEIGRNADGGFDLKDSPLTSYIYVRVSPREFNTLSVEADRYFTRKINAERFLEMWPKNILVSIIKAASCMVPTRSKKLKQLQERVEEKKVA